MSIENSLVGKGTVWIAPAALLAMAAFAPRATAARCRSGVLAPLAGGQSAPSAEYSEQEQEQEKNDRAQEARDREQEARDRELEKRDRLSELYDQGREALDENRYDRAEEKFDALAHRNGPQTDAALYWKAYAQNRLGRRDAALATIADLKRRFPQSRWQRDAGALQIEVQQRTGQPPHPETQNDDELKMLAIQG